MADEKIKINFNGAMIEIDKEQFSQASDKGELIMYIMSNFLDLAIKNLKKEWPSKEHRIMSEMLLICNPNVKTTDVLMSQIEKVLKIPHSQLKDLTFGEAEKLGFLVNF